MVRSFVAGNPLSSTGQISVIARHRRIATALGADHRETLQHRIARRVEEMLLG